MFKKLNNQDLIFITVGPILGLFILICLIYIIYLYFFKKTPREDELPIIESSLFDRSKISVENYRLSNDVNLIQKVNQEIRKKIRESRETASIYLQFFIRSNPETKFVSVEHLYNIGSQTEIERNWFLVKQTVNIGNSRTNKYRIIFINSIDSKSNNKIKKIIDIADSMSISTREMEVFIEQFFKSIKHPNILAFETLHLNLDKKKILCIQDYSRDGSLRDYLHKCNPNDVWEIKSSQATINSIGLKTIKEYSKQILMALIYLKQNFSVPFDNLHSGNVILAYKKRMCLLTGYENCFFFSKTRSDNKNEKNFERLRKIYLIQATEADGTIFRKVKSEIEKNRLIETIRFGFLIIEMCLGNEQEDLIFNDSVLSSIKSFYTGKEFDEIKNFLSFLFSNRSGLENNEKFKNKFVLPTLEQLLKHDFFANSKYNAKISSENVLNPEQIEFLNYMMGKIEIKIKKLKRRSSLALNQFSNKKQLSMINEATFEINEEKNETNQRILLNENRSKNIATNLPEQNENYISLSKPPPAPPMSSNFTISGPPPPPPPISSGFLTSVPPPPPISSGFLTSVPPPPPISSGFLTSLPPPPPSPPKSNTTLNSSSKSSGDNDRSGLLGDIRKGMKLKKTVTIDKSKPIF